MDAKKSKPPRNLRETKVWKDTIGACQQLWSNYIAMLKLSFRKMSRYDQEQMITKYSWVISMGVAALAYQFFIRDFLPVIIRVLALPLILVAAWAVGTRLVAPVFIKRFEKYLNQE